jgi:hypothetical protein
MEKGHTRYKLVRRGARGKISINGTLNSLDYCVIFRVTQNLQMRLRAALYNLAGRGLETQAVNCHHFFVFYFELNKNILHT